MEEFTLLQRMSRGRCPQGGGPADSEYCLFYGPLREPVVRQRITGGETDLVMELTYGGEALPGELRLRQVGSNLVIEESAQGLFREFLEGREVGYMGQALMYALQFRIQDLATLVERGVEDMKRLEDGLDRNIDNSGTYQILEFRRRYTDYGNQVIGVKEILARINRGYYPTQMQNSYVLQGQVEVDFQFLEERYELIKNTVIKDLDTYTSIVNNNINRNARLLSIVSLAAVAVNLMFGSVLALNPLFGIAGGAAVVGLTVGAARSYRSGGQHAIEVGGRRRGFPSLKGGARHSLKVKPAAEAVPGGAPTQPDLEEGWAAPEEAVPAEEAAPGAVLEEEPPETAAPEEDAAGQARPVPEEETPETATPEEDAAGQARPVPEEETPETGPVPEAPAREAPAPEEGPAVGEETVPAEAKTRQKQPNDDIYLL